MSKQLVVAAGDEDVTIALERMRAHGVRRLPVVGDGECLLGIVTLDDALHWLAQQVDALCEIVDKGRTREQRSKRG
jgi:CBS-domain-containing membrane protein